MSLHRISGNFNIRVFRALTSNNKKVVVLQVVVPSTNRNNVGTDSYYLNHIDSGLRIGGHIVFLQNGNQRQAKNILVSKSNSPIHIIGRVMKDNTVRVHSVNIFKNHKIRQEINIKYDSFGNIIPYNESSYGTHCHRWTEIDGKNNRGHSSSHEPIPLEYLPLLDKIARFNSLSRIPILSQTKNE